MTLEEAIVHLDESLSDQSHDWSCEECKQEHIQLREWLAELNDRRVADVVTPVRCRECKNWDVDNIRGRFPDGVRCFCTRMSGLIKNTFTSPDDYCCWGERKEDESK